MFVRSCLLALAFTMLAAFIPQARAQAPSATVQLHIVRGGYIFGGMGGHGTLYFQGRSYPLTIGGASVGLTIGGSVSDLTGQVYNLTSPYQIEGVYGAATSSFSVAHHGYVGASIHNAQGVLIHLTGRQVGLEFSLDLSGIGLHLR